MEVLSQTLSHTQSKLSSIELTNIPTATQSKLPLLQQIKSIGVVPKMDDYEKRKLGIFNLLNFFQLITGTLGPILGLYGHKQLPGGIWLIACLPASISILVLFLNNKHKYQSALLCYFILYPFITGIIYFNGLNLGVETFFILYGILSVFFLQDIGYMLFSLSLSMISYFVLAIVIERYHYQIEIINHPYFIFNQFLAIAFIFYGLFLIKKENQGYQLSILSKNHILHKKNIQIKQQKKEIAATAELLKKKTEELTEIDGLKNRLFSVIAHDLKAPMYALRNLFKNVQQFDTPAEDIKKMVPDIMNDLNYTVGLMENLLQWAKSQMAAHSVRKQAIDLSKLIEEVGNLLHLQAVAKKINIEQKNNYQVYAWADKDMVSLVLRNLLTNALKFTPEGGVITVGIHEQDSFIEVYVQDKGVGISKEALEKIHENNYYTTKGTASESGTGLGLMLCREFLAKNGGQMHIESKPGNGSTFSFTLPKPE